MKTRLIVFLMIALPASAALVCYNEDCLPAVLAFAGDRAILGGKFEKRTLLFRDGVWRETEATAQPPAVKCPREFRAKNYAESSEDDSWSIVCAETDDIVYGGLSFYEGEGITGRGGLLRFDKKTKRVAIRRLPILRYVSINSIAADGDVVWFGTTVNGECTGLPVAHGLVCYEWSTKKLKTWEGTDDGPIGGVIHGIAIRGDELWVATNLGISRLVDGKWHHYSPVVEKGRIVAREETARAIFSRLLRVTPRDCLVTDASLNELLDEIAKLRPKLRKRL